MKYNLTDTQKKLLQEIIENVKSGAIREEFQIMRQPIDGRDVYSLRGNSGIILDHATKTGLTALEKNELLLCISKSDSFIQKYSLTGEAYIAVQTNFNDPDTSFIQYLTPMANIDGFDEGLKKRCLPILAAGGSDPALWDSAVRTAGVILEERLRDVGSISDHSLTGQGLVNALFSKNGTLVSKFTVDAERQGYRDLYAGIVGTFRNPSAHKLIDPSPEDGGALIVFVNLLLKKLEELR
jgi:hypothetical protein